MLDEQHRTIRKCLSELQQVNHLAQSVELLDHLTGVLVPHFELEEDPSGILGTVEANAPHLLRTLAGVFAEHPAILAQVHQLRADLESCQASIDTLVAVVADHEERENAVFTDALYVDLGGSG
jgi:hypothetical protein